MDRTCGSIVRPTSGSIAAHGKLVRQWSCRGHATTVYSPGGPATIRALKTDEPLLDANAEASTSWLPVVRPDTSSLNTESSRLCTERRVKWTASPISKVLLLMLSCGAYRQKASVDSVALSKRAMSSRRALPGKTLAVSGCLAGLSSSLATALDAVLRAAGPSTGWQHQRAWVRQLAQTSSSERQLSHSDLGEFFAMTARCAAARPDRYVSFDMLLQFEPRRRWS